MDNLKRKLKEIEKRSYKSRFSLYSKPGYCLVRVYYSNGRQHKEEGKNIDETLDKVISFLKK